MGKIRGCSPTEDHQASRSTRNRQPQASKEQFEGDRGLRGAIKKVPADPHLQMRIGTPPPDGTSQGVSIRGQAHWSVRSLICLACPLRDYPTNSNDFIPIYYRR